LMAARASLWRVPYGPRRSPTFRHRSFQTKPPPDPPAGGPARIATGWLRCRLLVGECEAAIEASLG
jgi:hypothetical protein